MHFFANYNPIPWYRDFLVGYASDNASTLAPLIAWAELVVGLCLVLGVLVRPICILAFFMVANYTMATAHISQAYLGLNLSFLFILLALFIGDAGHKWG